MILIIDNGSTLIREGKRFLKENNVSFKSISHSTQLSEELLKQAKGIILTGGNGSPFEPLNLTPNFVALMNAKVPILGVCLGYEIIAALHLGKIERLPKQIKRMKTVTITKDPLFQGLPRDIELRASHKFHVATVPKGFEVLARSESCPIEAIKHKTKPIYGFQCHPEASGAHGEIIMRNFLKLCKMPIPLANPRK